MADDTLLAAREPKTANYDKDVVMQEESLLESPKQKVADICSDDTQTPHTETTEEQLNLAKRVWQQVNDTHQGRFTRLDFVLGIVGIILYIVDIATDLQLAISYFLGGHMIYGAMTTAFIGLAYIVVSGFGIYVFLENKKVPTAWWVCRIVFLILGLSPVILTVETMCYGMKSRARRKDGEREEEKDKRYTDHAEWTVVVRLFEGFLEAAPQLCFQLYITFKEKPDDDVGAGTLRGVTILSSWASLAVTAVKFHQADMGEVSTGNKKHKISCKLVYFFWRVCETGGRVLCIALFASTLENWVFGIVGFHFVLMLVWFVWIDSDDGAAGTAVFGVLFGYIMVFYIPFHPRPSRYLYLVYYALFYTENFLMLAFWAVMTSDRDAWFYIPAIVTAIVLFLLHIITQLFYYKWVHPKAGDIEWCMKCDRETVLQSLKNVDF
ncbi:hypothetical protein BaRGS_00026198 [Batillaria attramentaria]|uniref:XK-related protein n=1 Tax=Batillaria attramentaria TaxID=370345 RepID=A0ABD0K701_9CAEN